MNGIERLARARATLMQVEASSGVRSHYVQSIDKAVFPPGVYHVPLGIEGLVYSLTRVMTPDMWGVLVGVPDVGWEAAASGMHLDISRMVTVPRLSIDPAKTVGILVEGFDAVALGDLDFSVSVRRSLAARGRMMERFLLTSNPWVGISKPFPIPMKLDADSNAASRLSVFESGDAV
ncbi:hypothetical protein U6G28_09855 [Actinomycetaceae bacterium MB13-C1-2]|nr:hypothetical protein U6G28_09855 [Actinomycetaceae bacterium MB13-C1-2]